MAIRSPDKMTVIVWSNLTQLDSKPIHTQNWLRFTPRLANSSCSRKNGKRCTIRSMERPTRDIRTAIGFTVSTPRSRLRRSETLKVNSQRWVVWSEPSVKVRGQCSSPTPTIARALPGSEVSTSANAMAISRGSSPKSFTTLVAGHHSPELPSATPSATSIRRSSSSPPRVCTLVSSSTAVRRLISWWVTFSRSVQSLKVPLFATLNTMWVIEASLLELLGITPLLSVIIQIMGLPGILYLFVFFFIKILGSFLLVGSTVVIGFFIFGLIDLIWMHRFMVFFFIW